MYHLHTGVRAGGGIGDEIEPADGDAYEMYRILFDISFFFFVIVILLAIIQGKNLLSTLVTRSRSQDSSKECAYLVQALEIWEIECYKQG